MTTGALDIFHANRVRIFGIAYRMLGSATEAEDIVQEVWLRWQATNADVVREPSAFLSTIATRLCLTALDSARVRRESYVGPWLPEPVDTSADPLLGAERGEALSLAVLLLLERLTPPERAAYVLREAFAYSFREIAEVLEVSEANARQLATRARAHVTAERTTEVSATERSRLLEAFVAAAQSGNLASLEALLATDAITYSDGGGIVSAARKPIFGREKVAAFLLGVLAKAAAEFEVVPVTANTDVAFLGLRNGTPAALWTLDISAAGVERIYIVMNPTKLSQFGSLPSPS